MSGSTRAPSALWPIDIRLKQRALREGFLIEKPAPFQGRFSRVFLGYAEKNTARVIVKVTQRDRAEAEEENLLTLMDHPISGIPTLYGSWYDDQTGKGVIVTGLKEGIPLTQLFKDRVLPPREERIRIVKEVARFLKHAHEFGLFHGDIHMGQIVWDAFTNEVALVDWAGITSCHESFAAPEDRVNNPYHKNWGPWTDVYRFGLLAQIMWPEKANLFVRCLREHPRQRWTMDEVLDEINKIEKAVGQSNKSLIRANKILKWLTLGGTVVATAIIILSLFLVTAKQRAIKNAVNARDDSRLHSLLREQRYEDLRPQIVAGLSEISDVMIEVPELGGLNSDYSKLVKGAVIGSDPMIWIQDQFLRVGDWTNLGGEVGFLREVNLTGFEIKTHTRSNFFNWPAVEILDASYLVESRPVPFTVIFNQKASELGEIIGQSIDSNVDISGFFDVQDFKSVLLSFPDNNQPLIGYDGITWYKKSNSIEILKLFEKHLNKTIIVNDFLSKESMVWNIQMEDVFDKYHLNVFCETDRFVVIGQ